jgi:hypothetical protein
MIVVASALLVWTLPFFLMSRLDDSGLMNSISPASVMRTNQKSFGCCGRFHEFHKMPCVQQSKVGRG